MASATPCQFWKVIANNASDISITEAVNSLGLSQQMSSLDDQLIAIEQERKQFKRQIKELKDKSPTCAMR